ncbi:MAG: S46 family peptidase [Flavobacteriales bacterium]
MKNRFMFRAAVSITALLFSIRTVAHEGMWIPSVLGSIHDEMHAMGLELSVEDLYSINEGSLKDAVVLFGGGCTAEVVSDKGLMFTNHHCGFDYIQFHSSLENDYLKNGFWAMNQNEELVCKGLTATFVVRMDDVTELMQQGLKDGMTAKEMDAIRAANKKAIEDQFKNSGSGDTGLVRAYNYGNQYFLIVMRTFRDVRLVGAPPSEIGKFGGDTDNWVWPRHTGDFSVFRIYADANNAPADYNALNQPYKPGHFFPINLQGVNEGDFSMVYGFPGRTEHFLTSYAVDYVLNKSNAMRIKMREASLSIIDARMKSSDLLRIQYAAKQSDISNAYKKWIGQELGLKKYNALEIKQNEEKDFRLKAAASGKYTELLDKIQKLYSSNETNNIARDGFVEYVFYGPEVFAKAREINEFVANFEELQKSGKLDETRDALLGSLRLFYKDFDITTEKMLFEKMTNLYGKYVDPAFGPSVVSPYTKEGGTAALYDRSIMSDSSRAIAFVKGLSLKKAVKLKSRMKDPILLVSSKLFEIYATKITPGARAFASELDASMYEYVKAKQELIPSKLYWNDANSTLRISFGKVEGSAPHDGELYKHYTTADGILSKFQTGNPDFYIGEKLRKKLESRDFGVYGVNGTLPVCYTGSNHTTGGNSGSPALNAKGHLVGINFDRSWESTMSDIYYSPEICRNIMVDVRYVLWVIDAYAGAGYLLKEMKIVQ